MHPHCYTNTRVKSTINDSYTDTKFYEITETRFPSLEEFIEIFFYWKIFIYLFFFIRIKGILIDDKQINVDFV